VETLLLIEDHVEFAEAFHLLLEQSGFQVRVAHDAEEAWHRISSEKIDVILSDHTLRATTGAALYARLQTVEALAAVPFILWSSAELEPGTGFNGTFLRKGLPFAALIAQIRQLLEGAQRAMSSG
jgi:CheY-like chemotaxis protein